MYRLNGDTDFGDPIGYGSTARGSTALLSETRHLASNSDGIERAMKEAREIWFPLSDHINTSAEVALMQAYVQHWKEGPWATCVERERGAAELEQNERHVDAANRVAHLNVCHGRRAHPPQPVYHVQVCMDAELGDAPCCMEFGQLQHVEQHFRWLARARRAVQRLLEMLESAEKGVNQCMMQLAADPNYAFHLSSGLTAPTAVVASSAQCAPYPIPTSAATASAEVSTARLFPHYANESGHGNLVTKKSGQQAPLNFVSGMELTGISADLAGQSSKAITVDALLLVGGKKQRW